MHLVETVSDNRNSGGTSGRSAFEGDAQRSGSINLTHSSRAAIKFAQAGEAAGFWGVGIGDTVPERYQDTLRHGAACFARPSAWHIGPTVTNTVTRHWSVLGATRADGSASSTRAGSSLAWSTGDGAATRSA